MKVILMSYTPEPEKKVAAAARLCYSAAGPDELLENLDEQQVQKFLGKLVDLGHLSPTEHVTFTFGIEGVSRALSHQLVRHRVASYSQKSQRYVNEGQFEFVTPPSIRRDTEALELYQAKMREIQAAYDQLSKIVPKEDARYILPNACETKLVATFNTRSLYNFFQHRCCQRAQWEIRELAQQMLAAVKEVAPTLFAKAGASCITQGVCPEGSMTCGLLDKIKAKAAQSKTGEGC